MNIPAHRNRNGRNLSHDSQAVLAAMPRFRTGALATDIAAAIESPLENINKTLANLRQQGYVRNTAERGAPGRWVLRPKEEQARQRPKAEKAPAAVAQATQATQRPERATPLRNSTSGAPYVPHELRPFEGRPGAMDAFSLPSLVNGKQVAACASASMCGHAKQWAMHTSGRKTPK